MREISNMFGTTYQYDPTFCKIVDFMESKQKSNSSNKNLVSELKCDLRVKYTLNFKDIIWKREFITFTNNSY